MLPESVSKKFTMQAPQHQQPRISLIAAVSSNGVIGADKRMPWHLPEDLKHFKATTLGHPVIMGRKTWESIGRPLPGRQNIVVSRNPGLVLTGAAVVASLEQALSLTGAATEVFVIGGGELYRLALPLASRIVLTEIARHFDGDTHFPTFERSVWREDSRSSHATADGLGYDFVEYLRVPEQR